MIEYYRNKFHIILHFISFLCFRYNIICYVCEDCNYRNILCYQAKIYNQVEEKLKFTTVPRKVVKKINLCYISSTGRELDQIFLR